MANTYTLSEIETMTRELADVPSAEGPVSRSEIYRYINFGLAELTDLLVESNGDYYTTTSTFTTAAGTGSYLFETVAPNFYKLQAVHVNLGGQLVPVKRFNKNEEVGTAGVAAGTTLYGPAFRYIDRGVYLVFDPVPSSGQSIRLTYSPSFVPLSGSSQTFDGVNGWVEYVVVCAAIKCKEKQEKDVSVLLNMKAELKDRIRRMAPSRDTGEPKRMVIRGDHYGDQLGRRWRRWIP